jgi:O-antigen ligase
LGLHWGRSRGPFLQAAVNGTVLGMILPINLFLGMVAQLKPFWKRLNLFGSLLLPVAIYFTFTRACWLGAAISAGVMAIYFPKFRKLFIVLCAAGALLFAIRWTVNSISGQGSERLRDEAPVYYRIYLNDVSWRMFLERPLLGFGQDSFQDVSYHYFRKIKGIPYYALRGLAPHNTFLAILVELGIVGFIPLLAVFYFIFQSCRDYYRSRPRADHLNRGLVIMFGAATSTLIVNMLLIDMRYFAFPNSFFFLLAGAITGLQLRKA